MEKWIEEAIRAIRNDAEIAYEMLKHTAEKERVELDWALEVFVKEFNKVTREEE